MSFSGRFPRLSPVYEIPNDDLVGEVLIPAMRSSDEVRIAVGFFSSRCLAQIAPGLADFINASEGTLSLLVSPELSEADQAAIRRGVSEPQAVLQDAVTRLFEQARLSESAVERHTASTLSFLVASGRLQMRVVLMERGMYHKKIWLFGSGGDWLVVHGSGNATERGLLVNGEQMSIDRSWMDGDRAEQRVGLLLNQWETHWLNRHPTSITVKVDHALDFLREHAGPTVPTVADFWEAWRRDSTAGLEPPMPIGYTGPSIKSRLKIPDSLIWREGRFSHQGQAVDALLGNSGGILSMATGGGKTRTALIAASELQATTSRHLCVVILAPTRPLIRQWTADVQEFGILPIVLSGLDDERRRVELERVSLAFGATELRTEVFLLTNALFTQRDSETRRWFENLPSSVDRLLIADEVHNLGSSSFINDPPEFFQHRIGLSATPIRQYDPDGTDQLFDFFGGQPVFEFSLGDAISAGCLVPYSYYLHKATLTGVEFERYEDLTEELVRAGFRVDDDGRTINITNRIARLLRDRRALIEQADDKLQVLERELRRLGSNSISKTLIYASAKPVAPGKSRQITNVNRILQRLNIISHQYTAEETQSRQSQAILDSFAAGDYQVLTSMRVLDEGVNIPQTDTAFILASSTVEREWVQRRGRILRTSPNKRAAHLHDFIVIPPHLDSPAAKSLLRSELRRASAFADLADNEHDPGGPSSLIQELERGVWESLS